MESRNRNQTLTPNMKNFKSLRYVTDISSLYSQGKTLGEGAFGAVKRCTRLNTKKEHAMKIIKKSSLNSNKILPTLMMNELDVLKKTNHPNIMSVVEILEDENYYYVITEILEGGELFDRITEVQSFSEKKAAYILKQVLLAINYMHKKNISHRDLKPENILLESKSIDNLEVKIADFGFASFFDPKDGLQTILGSPLYMAPELVKAQKYDEKVDIWSIGVISYMLLSGRSPFPGRDKKEINYMIVHR